MSRDYELDRLKSEEQAAFQRKQSAWKDYADAKDRANTAYDEMESAWQERCRAREEMNREFEIMQNASSHHPEIWDEYGRIRDYNNSRIDSLRYEADSEHREMQMCFENASVEFTATKLYSYVENAPKAATNHIDDGHYLTEASTGDVCMLYQIKF